MLLCLGLAWAGVAQGQTLDDVRESLRQGLSNAEFAAGLVGLVTLANEIELAGADFDFDDTANTEVTTFGLPYQTTLDVWGEGQPGLYLEGAIGTARAKASVADLYGGAAPGLETSVHTKTRTYAGQAGIGAEYTVAQGLTLTPIVMLGTSYIENDADYGGPGAAVSQALLDGIAFNWDAWTYFTGVAGRVDYNLDLTQTLHLELAGRYDARFSETLDTTDPAQEFSDWAQILTLRADLTGPTGIEWNGNAVGWRAFVGSRHFLQGDLFDSTDYMQVGGALTFGGNLPKEMHVPDSAKFKLSGSLIFGDNLTGYGFGVSMEF